MKGIRERVSSAVSEQVWTCRLRGHSYELRVVPGVKTRVVLLVDEVQESDTTETSDSRTIRLRGGRRVEVRLSFRGTVKRAWVRDGDVELDFDAPSGSRAARLQEWGRAHPVWFALRHVAIKGGGILIALLGLGALFSALVEPLIRWIAEHMPHIDWPEIPWPDIPRPTIHVPYIPWPEIHLPRIPWPDIPPPAWLVALLDWLAAHEDILKPLFIGLVLAIAEMRRQRKQRGLREAGVDRVEATEADLHARLARVMRDVVARRSRDGRHTATPRS